SPAGLSPRPSPRRMGDSLAIPPLVQPTGGDYDAFLPTNVPVTLQSLQLFQSMSVRKWEKGEFQEECPTGSAMSCFSRFLALPAWVHWLVGASHSAFSSRSAPSSRRLLLAPWT